jgi:hypothetical protein
MLGFDPDARRHPGSAGIGIAAVLETFEAEARRWCRERAIDPDGSAPCIMVGPLGFAPEKYWIRRACQTSLAAEDRLGRARNLSTRREPPAS